MGTPSPQYRWARSAVLAGIALVLLAVGMLLSGLFETESKVTLLRSGPAAEPIPGTGQPHQRGVDTVQLLGGAAGTLRREQYRVFQESVMARLPMARRPALVAWDEVQPLTQYETEASGGEGAHLAARISEQMDRSFEPLTAACARAWPPLVNNTLQSVDIRVVVNVETVEGGAIVRGVDWYDASAWDGVLEQCVTMRLNELMSNQVLAFPASGGFRRRVVLDFRWLSPQRAEELESAAPMLEESSVPGLPKEEQEALEQSQGTLFPR